MTAKRERKVLFSSCRPLMSSTLRCTPIIKSSGPEPTRRAASAITRRSCCKRFRVRVPATASMRRRFAPTDPSEMTLMMPISPVADTWVPPHNSTDGPAERTRTRAPYLSPKNAIAPLASASSFDDSVESTSSFDKVRLLASSSMRKSSSSDTAS